MTDAAIDCNSKSKWYKIEVSVATRAGDIPITGALVNVDGQDLGRTAVVSEAVVSEKAESPVPPDGESTKTPKALSPQTALRQQSEAQIEVIYENPGEKLKREVFTVGLSGIDAQTRAVKPDLAKNIIVKVQDVLGSGSEGLSGDQDFIDEYSATGSATFEDTDDPDVMLLKVEVKLATISLLVPYLSQLASNESIVTSPKTLSMPNGKSTLFKGSILCMPTSTAMLFHYWGFSTTRNALMQKCWDTDQNASITGVDPWQKWGNLRKTAATLITEATPKDATVTYSVTSGPASDKDIQTIPSAYADALVATLTAGEPVVKSSRATDGHVMLVRGAVVDHEQYAQWLIFNDPYGTLAGEDSVYGLLDIATAVGLRGTREGEMNAARDVRAVREVLKKFSFYQGDLDATIDEADPNDPTVLAIKAFQGKGGDGRIDPDGNTEKTLNKKLAANTKSQYSTNENEINTVGGAGAERGRHVYYNGTTEAFGINGVERYRLKGQTWTLQIHRSPPYQPAERPPLLVPGT